MPEATNARLLLRSMYIAADSEREMKCQNHLFPHLEQQFTPVGFDSQ